MDNLKGQRMTDGLINYETVKYFANENHEVNLYNQAILNYQEKEYYNQISLNFLNTAQSCVIITGLVAGLLLCSARIAQVIPCFLLSFQKTIAKYCATFRGI